MTIHPVGVELFPADRRTDVTNKIVAFRNFAKEPNNYFQYKTTELLQIFSFPSFFPLVLLETDVLFRYYHVSTLHLSSQYFENITRIYYNIS
jgi:hypothetical protein